MNKLIYHSPSCLGANCTILIFLLEEEERGKKEEGGGR